MDWNPKDLVEAQKWRDAMRKLNAQFEYLNSLGKEAHFFDPDLIARITEFMDKTAGIVYVRNLNNEQLKELKKIISAVKTQVKNDGMLTSIKRKNSVADLAYEFADPLLKRKARHIDNAAIRTFDKVFNNDRIDALTFFSKLGEAGMAVYESLRNGFND